MAVKNIFPLLIGQAGIRPSQWIINTNDSYATVVANGYLSNSASAFGYSFSNGDLADVSILENNIVSTCCFQISISNGLISLVNPSNISNSSAGVDTWNGRSGIVLPESGDYSFSDISGTAGVTQGGTGLNSTTANRILYSTSNNTIGQITSVDSAQLITNENGVPSFTASMSDGQIVVGATDGTPAASTINFGNNLSSFVGSNWIQINTDNSFARIYSQTTSTNENKLAISTSPVEVTGLSIPFVLDLYSEDFDMTTDGRLKYTGTDTKLFMISASICINLDTNLVMQIYKNGEAIDGAISVGRALSNTCVLGSLVLLSTNDYLSTFVNYFNVSDFRTIFISQISVFSVG